MKGLRNYGLLLLNLLGLLGVLSMLQVLSYNHNFRIDLTPDERYTLSPHSQKILENLDQDVNVLAFVRQEDPRNQFLTDLFWRIRKIQPRIKSQVIDLNRNPSMARKYHVDSYGAVVVEAGARQKMFSNVREDVLLSAILHVTRNYSKTVYWMTGHGERDIESADRNVGYSSAMNVLEQELYEVEPLTIFGSDAIPDDAAAIVIAGPRQEFQPEELLKLEAYLKKGGSLLVMMDPGDSESMVAFLRRFHVDLRDEVVADPQYRMAASEPLSARIPDHQKASAVTMVLDTDPVFSLYRPIEIAGSLEGTPFSVLPLLRTSGASYSIPVKGDEIPEELAFDEARGDRRGPFTVGAELVWNLDAPAEEEPSLREGEEEPAPPKNAARIIVYGDSEFANNFFVDLLGNRDLLVNTMNRLAIEDQLIGIRPDRKVKGKEQWFISSKQGYWVFMTSVVAQPAVFLILGALVFLRRRLS